MKQRIAITGVGLLSPLGDRPETLHEGLCAGRSAVGPAPLLAGSPAADIAAAELADFEPRDYIGGNLRPLDRSSKLAVAAASRALADAGHNPDAEPGTEGRDGMGLVLGTMFGSIHTISEFDRRGLTAGPGYVKPLVFANTVINAAAGQTAIRLGLRGVNSTVAGGSASGIQALGYAADLIADGRGDVVLAGGGEELSPEAALGFARRGDLAAEPGSAPFDRARSGFALGEGAALLTLEGIDTAVARGARIRGEILGFGQAFDPTRGGDADSAVGALLRAVRAALAQAELAPEAIGCVFASANGSRRGDLYEGRALLELLGPGGPPIAAVKSGLGEGLGCAGALQVVAALEALARGEVAGILGFSTPEDEFAALDLSPLVRSPSGPVALITALGLDGQAAALVLSVEET